MEPDAVQQATAGFFVPVASAYLLACGAWWAVRAARPRLWPEPEELETDRRYLDLALTFAVGAAILVIGQVYRAGYLLPKSDIPLLQAILWNLNNVIIYSPLAVALIARKQSTRTIYLSARGLPQKVGLGLVVGVLSVLLFLLLRGELSRFPDIAARTFALDAIENFFPVFMEGVVLAFAFVRLRWGLGLWPALAIPALLFAAAHVPGSLEDGRSFLYISSFFVFNTGLTAAILYTVQRSRDVIWIGLVHYLMDIAIEAF